MEILFPHYGNYGSMQKCSCGAGFIPVQCESPYGYHGGWEYS